ncbi:MAG: iron-containing alcohol dehydrogenase [Chloroflexi bacterium]|nr:iron-containing alcohol dehydrogenase [Chloroflexota bacterium]
MWFFKSPEIVFGEAALDYLDELPGRRAFIVTDPTLHALGFTERVAARLRKAGLETSCFAEVEPEPSLETVYRGAAAIREFAPDWIVGLGGGSAMDAAKAMWVLYERPDLRADEISPLVTLGLGAKARLIAIPTTSGTGSEATWAFVLTDTAEGRKLGLGSRETLPTLAIVDPALTMGLPSVITADTGLDVLAHAVEGYSGLWRNDFSDGLCLKAMEMVFEYLPRAVADGNDTEAREKMANAAAIAGLGFGNAMAALAHAMGHALGAVFHQPHGRCVGMYLPYTIEFVARRGDGRYADIAHALHLPGQGEGATPRTAAPCWMDEAEAATALVAAIRGLMRQIGAPVSAAGMGISLAEHEAALERLCDLAEADTQIVTSARIPDRDELAALFRYAYDGPTVDF